jgi:hypothetical protein
MKSTKYKALSYAVLPSLVLLSQHPVLIEAQSMLFLNVKDQISLLYKKGVKL